MKNQMRLLVTLFILIFYSLQLCTQQKQIKGTVPIMPESDLMIKDSIMSTITDFDKDSFIFKKTLQNEKEYLQIPHLRYFIYNLYYCV